jgi:hypothetical protein
MSKPVKAIGEIREEHKIGPKSTYSNPVPDKTEHHEIENKDILHKTPFSKRDFAGKMKRDDSNLFENPKAIDDEYESIIKGKDPRFEKRSEPKTNKEPEVDVLNTSNAFTRPNMKTTSKVTLKENPFEEKVVKPKVEKVEEFQPAKPRKPSNVMNYEDPTPEPVAPKTIGTGTLDARVVVRKPKDQPKPAPIVKEQIPSDDYELPVQRIKEPQKPVAPVKAAAKHDDDEYGEDFDNYEEDFEEEDDNKKMFQKPNLPVNKGEKLKFETPVEKTETPQMHISEMPLKPMMKTNPQSNQVSLGTNKKVETKVKEEQTPSKNLPNRDKDDSGNKPVTSKGAPTGASSFDQRAINFEEATVTAEEANASMLLQLDPELLKQQKERVKVLKEYITLEYEHFDLFELYPAMEYDVYVNKIKAGLIKNSCDQANEERCVQETQTEDEYKTNISCFGMSFFLVLLKNFQTNVLKIRRGLSLISK